MKKPLAFLSVLCISAAVILQFASCGEEKNTPPVIAIHSSTGYISADDTLTHGTVFNVWLTASKTGTEGMLNSCSISKRVNGGADSVIQQMNFIYQSLSQTYSYIAGDSGNIERYTFTVGELDGGKSSVSLTITDN